MLKVEKELAALRKMTVTELRRRYEEAHGEECRSGNKDWIVKRTIWRMQANAEGDLSERARRRALELANDADLRLKAPKTIPTTITSAARTVTRKVEFASDARLPAGGEITRIYKGRQVRVRVLATGFEFEGEVYRSLSAVAKAITGSHVNGYHFFRLKGGAR